MLSDEALVRAFQRDDERAIEVLLERYQTPLWYYAWRLSWYRDKPFIDDICQRVFLTILKGLRNGRFTPTGAGSFKAWAYKISRNITLSENRKRRRRPRALSERYPEELPSNLIAVRPPPKEYHKLSARLDKVLTRLSPEERQLIRLVSENKTYQEIQKIPPFNKYRLESLRQKVCRIRQFLIKLLKETRNAQKK